MDRFRFTTMAPRPSSAWSISFSRTQPNIEAVPDFHQRALILHGTEDSVVPSQVSHDFALEHAHVRLALFKSGHELTDVLEGLWREASGFLEIP